MTIMFKTGFLDGGFFAKADLVARYTDIKISQGCVNELSSAHALLLRHGDSDLMPRVLCLNSHTLFWSVDLGMTVKFRLAV